VAAVPSQGCDYVFGEVHLLWSAKQLDVTYRTLHFLRILEVLLVRLKAMLTPGRFLETAIRLNQVLDLGVQSLSLEVSFQVLPVNDQPSNHDHQYRQKCLVPRNAAANCPRCRTYDC